MVSYIKSKDFMAATLGELVGPMGKTEESAVHLLTEYLLDDAGRNRFYDLYPDASESEYHEALYQLYELEYREDREAILSGASETSCNQCHPALVLN